MPTPRYHQLLTPSGTHSPRSTDSSSRIQTRSRRIFVCLASVLMIYVIGFATYSHHPPTRQVLSSIVDYTQEVAEVAHQKQQQLTADWWNHGTTNATQTSSDNVSAPPQVAQRKPSELQPAKAMRYDDEQALVALQMKSQAEANELLQAESSPKIPGISETDTDLAGPSNDLLAAEIKDVQAKTDQHQAGAEDSDAAKFAPPQALAAQAGAAADKLQQAADADPAAKDTVDLPIDMNQLMNMKAGAEAKSAADSQRAWKGQQPVAKSEGLYPDKGAALAGKIMNAKPWQQVKWNLPLDIAKTPDSVAEALNSMQDNAPDARREEAPITGQRSQADVAAMIAAAAALHQPPAADAAPEPVDYSQMDGNIMTIKQKVAARVQQIRDLELKKRAAQQQDLDKRKDAARQQRHSYLYDLIRQAKKMAKTGKGDPAAVQHAMAEAKKQLPIEFEDLPPVDPYVVGDLTDDVLKHYATPQEMEAIEEEDARIAAQRAAVEKAARQERERQEKERVAKQKAEKLQAEKDAKAAAAEAKKNPPAKTTAQVATEEKTTSAKEQKPGALDPTAKANTKSEKQQAVGQPLPPPQAQGLPPAQQQQSVEVNEEKLASMEDNPMLEFVEGKTWNYDAHKGYLLMGSFELNDLLCDTTLNPECIVPRDKAIALCNGLPACLGYTCLEENGQQICQLRSEPLQHEVDAMYTSYYKDDGFANAERLRLNGINMRLEPGSTAALGYNPNGECGVNGYTCVISYNIYTSDLTSEQTYMHLLADATLAAQQLPKWKLRVYHNGSLRKAQLTQLYNQQIETILIDQATTFISKKHHTDALLPSFLALLVADDLRVDRYIIRDVDTRISDRELKALEEWRASKYSVHIMRDHPHDKDIAMPHGSIGGVKGSMDGMNDRLNTYLTKQKGAALTAASVDDFLATNVWPAIKADQIAHDAWSCYLWPNARSFPTLRNQLDFVGSKVSTEGKIIDPELALVRKEENPEACRRNPNSIYG